MLRASLRDRGAINDRLRHTVVAERLEDVCSDRVLAWSLVSSDEETEQLELLHVVKGLLDCPEYLEAELLKCSGRLVVRHFGLQRNHQRIGSEDRARARERKGRGVVDDDDVVV